MSDSFPLANLRQTIDKQWEQVEIIESITVPASKVLKLKEVPDDGTVSPKPAISGLTETTTYPPNSGEFYVNYCTGYIEFHTDQIGFTDPVTYWGKGSLVESFDINYLDDKHVVSGVAPTGYYGQQWFNTNNGLTYNYDIRDKWLSLDRQMFAFGRRGKTNNQYLNYFGGTLPSITSGIRVIRDACITGMAGQIKDIGTCTFYIRINNSVTSVTQLDILTDYGNENDSININLNKGDTIHCYFDSIVERVNPMVMVELAWR
jgi:hypothetical protein